MFRLVPLLAFVAALVASFAPDSAQAQCWGYRCGGGVYVPPPRRVYVRPVPPRYYVRPHTIVIEGPAPAPAPPPPPAPSTVIIIEPPQGQVQMVEPEPEVVEPEPAREEAARPSPSEEGRVGLHGSFGGIIAGDVRMGGFAAALRIRPSEHFAFDIGMGAYGGDDFHGNSRVEVPITVDLLAFVNPQRRLQLYFVVGAGTSVAFLNDERSSDIDDYYRAYTYLGGTAGIGLEWRLARHIALNVDGRVFLRRRIDSSEPEFVDGSRQTNTSAGFLGNAGMTVYF